MDTHEGSGSAAADVDPGDAPPDDGDGFGGDAEEGAGQRARHYSTGKLTVAQARIVDGWRRQLTVPDRRRWHTENYRPPASSSDCIAAAVVDMLDRAEPDHLAVIGYAARLREEIAVERGRSFPSLSVVSFYLPADYAARAETLLAAAHAHHVDVLDQVRERVRAELPGAPVAQQAIRMLGILVEMGVPSRVYRLPVGTLARYAITRWARRAPVTVVAAAVAHGRQHHEQMHRARRDMGVGDVRS
ncbi:hypothetical protein [Nocardia sp. alder85J]|uniref:hypothetical protein n=1 Tax=Nocardia sp. alder85J TaxID=2862949 RepID=UPI001CD6BE5B|nr:hypothetical protein [Nocardia sp. alder85J]MCX4099113.1 hypothetical protein [Nocardia sp. alder85J]